MNTKKLEKKRLEYVEMRELLIGYILTTLRMNMQMQEVSCLKL